MSFDDLEDAFAASPGRPRGLVSMHTHDRTLLASLGFADPDKTNPLHDLGSRYFTVPENHHKLIGGLIKQRLKGTTRDVTWSHPQLGNGSGRTGAKWTTHRPATEVIITKGEGQYKTHVGFVDAVVGARVSWYEKGTYFSSASLRLLDKFIVRDLDTCGDGMMFIPHGVPFQAGVVLRQLLEHRIRRETVEQERKRIDECVDHAGNKCSCDNSCACKPLHVEWNRLEKCWSDITDDPVVGEGTYEEISKISDEQIAIEVKIGEVSSSSILRQLKLYGEFFRASSWVVATLYRPLKSDTDLLQHEGITHVQLGPRFLEWAKTQKEQVSSAEEF